MGNLETTLLIVLVFVIFFTGIFIGSAMEKRNSELKNACGGEIIWLNFQSYCNKTGSLQRIECYNLEGFGTSCYFPK